MIRAIRKLLIANRGEIAVRIIRTAREMNILTVLVCSESDKRSLASEMADETITIGDSESSESYLNIERVMSAAQASRADAVHPGYGFLSERPEFSAECERLGLIFVGPSSQAMTALGSKIDAKKLALSESVPVVPGYSERGASLDELKRAATMIGFPILLKASAGGGGRGMRVVESDAEFDLAFQMASSEAFQAFGDGEMMLERLIQRPRHIEVQFLADEFGTVRTLFERECSLQRRRQKVVEEGPSPMHRFETLWAKMRNAAERLVKAAHYVGAGTVEFIVDEAAQEFYFIEVNARLQVEHPVTELITGTDLVRWQLRIALGEALELGEILDVGGRGGICGHAIEARILAENPAKGFLPSTGTLLSFLPPIGPGVRVDTGYRTGDDVTRFYDSLLAKVICHGECRADALDRLRRALAEFHILGVDTNIAYLLDVLACDDFQSGRLDTGLLEREFSDWVSPAPPVALGAILKSGIARQKSSSRSNQFSTAWADQDGFRMGK